MKKEQAFKLGLKAAEVVVGFQSLLTGATIRVEFDHDAAFFFVGDDKSTLYRRESAFALLHLSDALLQDIGRAYARDWRRCQGKAITTERAARHETLYRDPVQKSLDNAPLDDEPTTRQDDEAIERGKKDIEAGRVSPSDEVKARRNTCIPMWRTLVVRIEELNKKRLSQRTAEGYRRLNGEYREARAELYRLATNGKELEL